MEDGAGKVQEKAKAMRGFFPFPFDCAQGGIIMTNKKADSLRE
jgi:hypothetical protein